MHKRQIALIVAGVSLYGLAVLVTSMLVDNFSAVAQFAAVSLGF